MNIRSSIDAQPLTTSRERIDRAAILSCVVVALALGTMLRWLVNRDEALWYDEVWTGTIAAQDWRGAIEILEIDFNAPLYYLTVWAWTKFFGLSDAAIRAPGLLATIAAPFAAWFLLRGRAPLNQRALFTIMIALWIPGLYYAQEARSYAFTVLGSVVQTVFFFRTLQSNGGRGDIAAWALSGLVLGLTHYTTMLMSAVQGLALLALFWRTRFASLVFAGLAFAPVLLVFLSHFDAFRHISNFEYFWLKTLRLRDIGSALKFVAGESYAVVLLACAIGVALVADARSTTDEGRQRVIAKVARLWLARLQKAVASPLFLTALVSLIGLGLFLAIAVFRPVFLPRYLIPFAPGLFLGLIWIIDAMPRARLFARYATAGVFLATALIWGTRSAAEIDKVLTWKEESAILKDAGVSEALFFLDQGYPTPYPEFLHRKVFGFFLARDGADATVREFVPDFQLYSDPRPHLIRFLSERPGRGLIWTLFPGPTPEPVAPGPDGKIKRIRERGFSAVYDHTVMEDVDGITCRATPTAWYPKYVCYSDGN